MPYEYVQNHPECENGKGGLVKLPERELLGCHSSRESANEQIQAIEANKNMHDRYDMLVGPHGGSVKDLDDKGTFGTYLVLHTDPDNPDLEQDFFHSGTEHWLDNGTGKSAVLYAHGLDPQLGKKRIDKGWAKLVLKDAGVWMETQLHKRNKYEEMIHELAKRGKLGASSGTATHLVEREEVEDSNGNKVYRVDQWPLGLDGTLTPTPAESRLKVQPLKSIITPSIKDLAREVLGVEWNYGVQGKTNNVQILVNGFKDIKVDDDDIDERYSKFTNMVNMSASEIERWGETECSDKASQKPQQVRNRVIRLLRTNKSEWGDKEYEDAGRVINFISRMRGNDSGDPVSEDCPSKRDISLRNWGYDPMKSLYFMQETCDNAKSMSYRQVIDAVRSDFKEQYQDERRGSYRMTHGDVYPDFVIVRERDTGKMYRVEYNGDMSSGYNFQPREEWVEVVVDTQVRPRSVEDQMKELENELDGMIKNLSIKAKYSNGDLVKWENGSAQGRVRRVVTDGSTVSPSTTDQEFGPGTEDNPVYLIELVDKDEDGNIVGRNETVAHREGTLSKASQSDVTKKSLDSLPDEQGSIQELESLITKTNNLFK